MCYEKVKSGVCRFCGCTEEHGCEDGMTVCHWVDLDKTICSKCQQIILIFISTADITLLGGSYNLEVGDLLTFDLSKVTWQRKL